MDDAALDAPVEFDAGHVDVVIVRDIGRLTRNLADWNAFEQACVRRGVRLSAYTGGDLDLCTAEGAYYGLHSGRCVIALACDGA